MSFKKEIEQYLELISVWEELFRKVKDLNTLPVSFFSASLDILDQLKSGLYEMESLQLDSTDPAISLTGNSTGSLAHTGVKQINPNVPTQVNSGVSTPANEPAELPVDELDELGFLDDKISKKIYADLTKSLTINQRFMFFRDVFNGNEAKMDGTLMHLNALQTFEEAMDYLQDNHPVAWETEAGIAFKELLKKHFA